MGPFVPDVISDQLSLIVALFLGIGFGFVLEQAGFSSSRRLAGLFFGYDFTVLRVFFTAAITAMAGILLLGYFGYLDLSIIYVNPTFLWPTVVGGAVMGLGFILGGYCPGTSVAAAAIGKVDAMFFILGGVVGIWGFGEAYTKVQAFNDSSSLGAIKVYGSLHMSQGAFILMLVVVAVGAFAATSWIEQKVNANAPSRSHNAGKHRLAAAALVLLAVILAVLPDRKAHMMAEVSSPGYEASHPVAMMAPDELAFRIVDQDPKVKVFDLRPASQYSQFTLPGAVNMTWDDFFGHSTPADLSLRNVKKVFVANTVADEQRACRLAEALGYRDSEALDGGYSAFDSVIMTHTADTHVAADVAYFRQEAASQIAKLYKEAKSKGTGVKKPAKKIQGGC